MQPGTSRHRTSLTELARVGFAELGASAALLATFPGSLVLAFAGSADPDQSLRLLDQLRDRAPSELTGLLRDPDTASRLVRVLGASAGLGEFFRRLAMFGGFLGRKGDGQPGWQTIWGGLEKLLLCIRGAQAMSKCG